MTDPLTQAMTGFLRAAGGGDQPHTGTTFVGHLLAVQRLLAAHGCGPDVCRAGFFHSIYGTEVSTGFKLPLDRRADLRALIGERAERLAYLNCATTRASLDAALACPTPPYPVHDRFAGGELNLDRDDFDDLCLVHLFDWLEQAPRVKLGAGYRRAAFRQMAERLGPAAVASYDRVFPRPAARLATRGRSVASSPGDERYRVVDEATTVRALLHHCWPDEVRAGDPAAPREAGRALDRLVARGLPFARRGPGRAFDFAEVLNAVCRGGRESDEPAYLAGVSTFRRAFAELDQPGPRRFEVHLRREFHLPAGTAGESVRLRVPLPLADRAADVTVEVHEPAAPLVSLAPGRLDVRLPAGPVPPVVAVEVRIGFTAAPQTVPIDPDRVEPIDPNHPDVALYTRPHDGLVRVTPGVTALAAEVAGAARTPWDVLVAVRDFLFDRMASGRIHHDALDAADPLPGLAAGGVFDCLTGSSLLAALCRARGVPVRVVNGFTLYRSIPANHFWAEVLVPPFGWVPVDLAAWDLAAGDRRDPAWGGAYLGRLDPRMTCQVFPHAVTGPVGVKFPRSWYVLPAVDGDGLESTYYSLDTGAVLYADWLRVSPPDEPHPAG